MRQIEVVLRQLASQGKNLLREEGLPTNRIQTMLPFCGFQCKLYATTFCIVEACASANTLSLTFLFHFLQDNREQCWAPSWLGSVCLRYLFSTCCCGGVFCLEFMNWGTRATSLSFSPICGHSLLDGIELQEKLGVSHVSCLPRLQPLLFTRTPSDTDVGSVLHPDLLGKGSDVSEVFTAPRVPPSLLSFS